MSASPIFAPQRTIERRVDSLVQRLSCQLTIPAGDICIVRAPLRICPLGAHIDHQHGIVTGMAIDQSILMAFAPTADGLIHVESGNFPGAISFNLSEIPPFEKGDWGNYVRGAALAMRTRFGVEGGFCGIIDSDMPVGGLSSSAAVTIAYLTAFQYVNQIQSEAQKTVELVTATEHDYIGLRNGILDQSSILFSRKSMLTRIDCRSVEIDRIGSPLDDEDFALLIVYSGVTEGLMGTGYNRRVEECAEAAQRLMVADAPDTTVSASTGESPRLRDVDPDRFRAHGDELPEQLRKRAAHYFGEMQRVEDGTRAWISGDIQTFGRLVNESGHSSVHNYECGSPELISLYDILAGAPGVFGARFSGAGFRGNCIALVDPARAGEVAERVHAQYPAAHPQIANRYSIHLAHSADGAGLMKRE